MQKAVRLKLFKRFCFKYTAFLIGIAHLPMVHATPTNMFNKHWYIGAGGGVGSTTWMGLVPHSENDNIAMRLSTPTRVEEGGNVWGFFAGYEFTPTFALEANYMRYPSATIYFDAISLFCFFHNRRVLVTETESVNLMGKIMLIVPNTALRFYSAAGAALVHRNDFLNDKYKASPSFGLGVNYHINEHLMGEIAGNYTAGYGESQLNPVDSYFPFLYSVTMRLAYVF